MKQRLKHHSTDCHALHDPQSSKKCSADQSSKQLALSLVCHIKSSRPSQCGTRPVAPALSPCSMQPWGQLRWHFTVAFAHARKTTSRFKLPRCMLLTKPWRSLHATRSVANATWRTQPCTGPSEPPRGSAAAAAGSAAGRTAAAAGPPARGPRACRWGPAPTGLPAHSRTVAIIKRSRARAHSHLSWQCSTAGTHGMTAGMVWSSVGSGAEFYSCSG